MILTITPNPSIDLLFEADALVWDDANRLDAPRRRAGGQGVNLTRAARALGGEATAVALLGGAAGAELRGMLEAEGTPLVAVPVDAETRVFVGVRERGSGRSLLLNPRGPRLTEADGDRLLEAVEAAMETLRPTWVVCSGSIPPGIDAGLYARIGELAAARHTPFVADCDGPALQEAASACAILSPNTHEAERLLELEAGALRGDAEAAGRAACEIARRHGARIAFVTMGAEGAVAGDAGGSAWHATADANLPVASAVGAGDAFLAAALLAIAAGDGPDDALAAGVAAGAAVLRSAGAALVDRSDFRDLLQTTKARQVV